MAICFRYIPYIFSPTRVTFKFKVTTLTNQLFRNALDSYLVQLATQQLCQLSLLYLICATIKHTRNFHIVFSST